jgi:hypothetical protein
LLRKWDATRDIDRHQIYKKLSLKRKEDLLSQLAFDTFDRGEYFFKQSTVERYITEYIRNIPGTATDEEALQLDSEAVLRSIMAQHGLLVERAKGIFSFSHLTFHEYFAAKRIVDSSIAQGNEGFLRLVKSVNTERWREIFFLVVEMLPDASVFLLTIKQEIDGLLAGDEKLQEYLVWLDEKCRSIEIDNRLQLRMFNFSVGLWFLSNISNFGGKYFFYTLYKSIDQLYNYSPESSLDFALLTHFSIDNVSDNFNDTIARVKSLKCSPIFLQDLNNIIIEIPEKECDFQTWHENHFTKWKEKFRVVIIKHRNIGHDWKLNGKQEYQLHRYYVSSELLKECLESECYIDLDTRQYITDTFCRPLHLIPPRS